MKPLRRHTLGYLLLLAYLPLLVASVFHTHRPPVPEAQPCSQCALHIAHPAHLGADDAGSHHCLYCHLLAQPRLAAAVIGFLFSVSASGVLSATPLRAVAARRIGTLRLRAPPAGMIG